MKILDGRELAEYIQERQARQVRGLRQAYNVFPKLAIVMSSNNPVIETYVNLKKTYGAEILIDVDVHNVDDDSIIDTVNELNDDESVHGIIIQLPLTNPDNTDAAVNAVVPLKDVDGLGENAVWTPATAMAIDWLAAGYNVTLKNRPIVIVGNGRLVGQPLAKLWQQSGLDVKVLDSKTEDMATEVRSAQIVVTATGVPSLITASMLQSSAVVIDAGTAAEHGKIVGDLADDVRERDDLTITPVKGGVGPLTVSALFDNVIRAAQRTAGIHN